MGIVPPENFYSYKDVVITSEGMTFRHLHVVGDYLSTLKSLGPEKKLQQP